MSNNILASGPHSSLPAHIPLPISTAHSEPLSNTQNTALGLRFSLLQAKTNSLHDTSPHPCLYHSTPATLALRVHRPALTLGGGAMPKLGMMGKDMEFG